MSDELNIATRRLLQVVLDMLSNPDTDSKDYNGNAIPYRCDLHCVEAAHRAAKQAQEMLAEAMAPVPHPKVAP